ncbi:hypothetical protein VTL71DRAFT_316 [Oculimacula yallundae]|uniref:AAA+ ATPase domain-containing protein n=1 Tax=Oculimacula yallundae TaxID=86028 RepID=A0ABR4CZT3_9HELO
MRLINTSTLALQEFFGENIPHYAILSHRWERDEVTFQDFQEGKGPHMVGWAKVSGCRARAALDGWKYVWIDSCCIDKSSSAELAEAINSMFEWYRKAQVCYAYLSDVPTAEENPYDDLSSFRKSKWFSRGWTLQELLAPDRLEFFDRDWKQIGTKLSFADLIQSITGIAHLVDYQKASVAQRLSWASQRETTRLEDQAYCLLGLFNVYMPLLYGEGPKAFLRLQQEIISKTEDDTIFAWEGHGTGGLLASSPSLYQGAGDVVLDKGDSDRPPHSMTSKGVRLELTLLSPDDYECIHGKDVRTRVLAPINCKRISPLAAGQETDLSVALVLYRQTGSNIWRRERRLVPIPVRETAAKDPKRTLVYVPQPTLSDENNVAKNIDEITREIIADSSPTSQFRFPVIRTIDWRGQLCQFLDIPLESPDDTLLGALEVASEKLKEATQLSDLESKSEDISPRYQVIHKVLCGVDQQVRLFVNEPSAVSTFRQRSHLRSDEPIYNLDHYLERNKNISFIVYKEYRCCDLKLQQRFADKIGIPNSSALLISEGVSIISPDLGTALTLLAEYALVDIPHPDFLDVKEVFNSPYIWWFCRRKDIARVKESLNKTHRDHVSIFERYLEVRFEVIWAEVDALLSKGKISGQYIDYLYSPNMILVAKSDKTTAGQQQAYLSTTWLYTNSGGVRAAFTSDLSHSTDLGGLIEGASWTFDGVFRRKVEELNVGYLPSSSVTEAFDITDLNFYPIEYARPSLENELRKRGKMFWACRSRKCVSYCDEATEHRQDNLQSTSSRFMIDTATYNQMHSTKLYNPADDQGEIGPERMSSDLAPEEDEILLCLPNTIPGFNLITKSWTSLDVSRITPVKWKSRAFKSLILRRSDKELILALVTNKFLAKKSPDETAAKGSGLMILLHGPPGVGKTMTAECVSEVTKRPLYRVTCGDIGTSPEHVEQYLMTVFQLGKLWGCVVLLDEADTFLEQRDKSDPQRNALVSVFLRVLEDYDGILILTSNRIQAFHEGFRSRIQLALRYFPLQEGQRLRIWESSIHRLKPTKRRSTFESISEPDTTDLGVGIDRIRAKLPELAKTQMNGREIRNAISSAKQLAAFRKEEMTYEHLKSVIEVATRFDEHFRPSNVKLGFSEDETSSDESD